MKIKEVNLIKTELINTIGEIEPAWNQGTYMKFDVGGNTFTEIITDEGISGYGPAVSESILNQIKNYLIGKDPLTINQHFNELNYQVSFTPYQGITGIDIALWDIKGKYTGLPLYKLWGGSSNKIIPYASLISLSGVKQISDITKVLLDEGWKAIKLRLHHETINEDIAIVTEVRKIVGDKMTIMVDANQAQSNYIYQSGIIWDFSRAKKTAIELEKLDIFWLEEPLARHDYSNLTKLNQELDLHIAGGENNTNVDDFIHFTNINCYDIYQPESMVLGGVTPLLKIGTIAELYRKKIVPHHGGGDLGLIANAHLVASWDHSPYLEMLHEPPVADFRHKLFSIVGGIDFNQGYITLSEEPGLGIKIKK